VTVSLSQLTAWLVQCWRFLQERFTAGLSLSTLKVYVVAIGAYHISLDGMSVGKDPLVSRFLRGTLRLWPAARMRVPTWDLAIVLQGLPQAPFKPLEVPARYLTLKTLFLLALKRKSSGSEGCSLVLGICAWHG